MTLLKYQFDAICKHFMLTYIERHGRTARTFWNYATGTLTPSKGPDTMLKPDRVFHLNCEEARTHASCKTDRTMERFNH